MNFIGLTILRNTTKLFVIFGFTMLCLIWSGLFFTVQRERQGEIDNAFKDTAAYARTFAEHSVRTIKGLDQIALFLKYQTEKEGMKLDIPKLVSESRFTGQPFILLSVINENGDLISSSQVPFVASNIKDREHFLVHKEFDIGLFISKPVLGRSSGKWSIQLSRRINKADGSFGGVVVVSVDPNYFAEFYKLVNLGEQASISLIGRDGIARIRQSGKEISVGQDFSQSILMQKIMYNVVGNFTTQSQFDDIERIYSYCALFEYPLVVTVGVSKAQVFAGLNQRIVSYFWACGAMSILVILFVITLLADISRRKKAESALRRSAEIQSLLREIAEAAVTAGSMDELYATAHRLIGKVLPAKLFHINLLDETTNEIVVPFNADDVTFIPPRRPVDKGITEYIMQIGHAVHITPEEMDKLIENGEYRLAHVQKVETRHYLGAPLIDSQGKPFGVLSLIQMGRTSVFQPDDVEVLSIIAAQVSLSIERKRTEEKLRQSEEKYRYMTENASDVIWHLDQNYRFDYISPSDERMRGFKRDEVIGTTFWRLLKPEGIEQIKRKGTEPLAEDHKESRTDAIRYELELLCKNGSWIWTEVSITAHHDQSGQLTGLQGITRDISERKRAENHLRESQARYHALVDQSFEAMALIDLQTREAVEANRRFTELLGYSLPQDAPLFVDNIVIDSDAHLNQYYNEILKHERVLPAELRIVRHKNGSDVPVERAGSVIRINEKDFLLATMRDMTEERRRQAELTRDAELARRVQKALLPELASSPYVAVRTVYFPLHFVSGDSYHLEWRNEGKLLRGFLLDVSGHGLATAIQTSSLIVLLCEEASSHLPLLSQLRRINDHASKYFTEGAFAAMIGFELDLVAKELRYVSAGITQFYVNGKKILTPGMFVGLWNDAEFGAGSISVSEGDTLYFLTDGFTDLLSRPENSGFWPYQNENFDNRIVALEGLATSGQMRDDASGICIKIRQFPVRNGEHEGKPLPRSGTRLRKSGTQAGISG